MVWFICMGNKDSTFHNQGYAVTYPSLKYAASDSMFGSIFWSQFFMEFLATFFLVFVVFAVAVDQKNVRNGGFGSAFGIGGHTGAALNPARWLGPWIVSLMACDSTEKTGQIPCGVVVYTLACFGGGAVGGITYKALFL